MKVVILALLLVSAALVVAPPASAECYEDYCDPPPMGLCPPVTDRPLNVVGWAKDCFG